MKTRIGISAALAFLGAFLLWTAVGTWVSAEAVYPLERGAGFFSRCVWHPLREAVARPRLVSENRRLLDEVARLRVTCGDLKAVREENARLRLLLDYQPNLPGDWLAAPVLSRGGALGARDLLRVGKGTRAGVRVGAAVASPDGLVGRVAAVTPHTADVRLITDPRVGVSCEIEGGPESAGVIFGILSGTRLVHVRRDAQVSPHARIVTSGLGGVYPRGIAVGRLVYGTHEDETQLEREGEVRPAVDFANLDDVFIRREN